MSQRSARACLAPAPARPALACAPCARLRALRSPARLALACAPNLPYCLATIQYFVLQPKISQPKPLSHNTSNVLRYTFCLAYPLPVAIQGLISQHNPLLNQPPSSHLGCNTNLVLKYNPLLAYSSCNTIWAVAQLKSAQNYYFFSFYFS